MGIISGSKKNNESLYDMSRSLNIKDYSEYYDILFSVVKCPICGKATLDNYFICPNCLWEYDGCVEDEKYSEANGYTVQEYRDVFEREVQQNKGVTCHEKK